VAHPEEPQRPLTGVDTAAIPGSSVRARPQRVLALGAAALGACLLCYLAVAVPGAWFPSAPTLSWSARDLRLAEGGATISNGEFVVTAVSPRSAVALITLQTDFRAQDYPGIAWVAIDVPDNAQVQMIWRTDYAPLKLNTIGVPTASGRLLPVVLANDPDWGGRITGIALSMRGPFSAPVRIRAVTAKPMGIADVVADRAREWFAFEGWTGTSINTVTGGADVQDLPLPALFAASIVLAAAVWLAWAWRRRTAAAFPAAIAMLFVASWLVLDARWMWNLARQVRVTAAQYAGKDWHERRLAAEDGALFAFIEKARAKMPAEPARVFMLADAHYFRGRGAYHLYPHNVWFDPYQNAVPPASQLHTGDYVVVYQRRGVQYNAQERHLRWDGGTPLPAELLFGERGGALFRIL
jgi:hypothetical protein